MTTGSFIHYRDHFDDSRWIFDIYERKETSVSRLYERCMYTFKTFLQLRYVTLQVTLVFSIEEDNWICVKESVYSRITAADGIVMMCCHDITTWSASMSLMGSKSRNDVSYILLLLWILCQLICSALNVNWISRLIWSADLCKRWVGAALQSVTFSGSKFGYMVNSFYSVTERRSKASVKVYVPSNIYWWNCNHIKPCTKYGYPTIWYSTSILIAFD